MKTLLVGGLLVLLAGGCGGGSAPPAASSAPSPTASASASPAADDGETLKAEAKAIEAKGLEAMTSTESKGDFCDDRHKAALEKVLDEVETNLRDKGADGKPAKLESFTKKTLSLSDAAKGFSLKLTGRGTQVHVVAVAIREVSLDALAGGTAATTMRSPYQRDTAIVPATIAINKNSPTKLESDSRQIEMKAGQELHVKLRGQGCAGVVVFSKM